MNQPQLVFVVGCNAAGKSSFIRSRMNELEDFEIIMTDVYKSRAKQICLEALEGRRDIILETVFNDASFADIVDKAHLSGYHTSLVVLFLDNPQESIDRVAARRIAEGGLFISGSNIKYNFNESFKHTATYYFYFDQSDFIYTGFNGSNDLIMRFEKSELVQYNQNDLKYPQKFADHAFHWQRLNENARDIIKKNADYIGPTSA